MLDDFFEGDEFMKCSHEYVDSRENVQFTWGKSSFIKSDDIDMGKNVIDMIIEMNVSNTLTRLNLALQAITISFDS